jgi:hypothetical protein
VHGVLLILDVSEHMEKASVWFDGSVTAWHEHFRFEGMII